MRQTRKSSSSRNISAQILLKMNYSIFILAFLIATLGSPSLGQNKLPISIYYEALCPDSSRFITNQLYPVYQDFKDYVDITYVVFGKAESIENKAFRCQHGQSECEMNMVQSCALYIRAGNSDEQMEYVNCQMKMPFVTDTNSQICLNKSEDRKVTDCYNGGLGYLLQVDAERITHKIAKPYPSWVPTIVYNNVFNQTLQDRSEKEFTKVVCELINNRAPYC